MSKQVQKKKTNRKQKRKKSSYPAYDKKILENFVNICNAMVAKQDVLESLKDPISVEIISNGKDLEKRISACEEKMDEIIKHLKALKLDQETSSLEADSRKIIQSIKKEFLPIEHVVQVYYSIILNVELKLWSGAKVRTSGMKIMPYSASSRFTNALI